LTGPVPPTTLGYSVPVVASELRLLSDVVRNRPERWYPVAARLAVEGYDDTLIDAALTQLPAELEAEVRTALTSAPY
jgi:hypothetical protein